MSKGNERAADLRGLHEGFRLCGFRLQTNVIKLSTIKKHFIVAQASCLCEIQAGCLYHHVKIYKGGTTRLPAFKKQQAGRLRYRLRGG